MSVACRLFLAYQAVTIFLDSEALRARLRLTGSLQPVLGASPVAEQLAQLSAGLQRQCSLSLRLSLSCEPLALAAVNLTTAASGPGPRQCGSQLQVEPELCDTGPIWLSDSDLNSHLAGACPAIYHEKGMIWQPAI